MKGILRLRNYDLFIHKYKILLRTIDGELDTWDVQLQWNIILNKKCVVVSHENLIYNNGLDDVAATQMANYNNLLFREAKEISEEIFKRNNRPDYFPQYDIHVFNAVSNTTKTLQFFSQLIWPKHLMITVLTYLKRIIKLSLAISVMYYRNITNRPLINLIVAGEQKCGTTSLYELLKSSKEISAGFRKEKQLFNNETLFKGNRQFKSQKHILNLFSLKEICKSFSREYFLDVTPDYVFDREALQRIAA